VFCCGRFEIQFNALSIITLSVFLQSSNSFKKHYEEPRNMIPQRCFARWVPLRNHDQLQQSDAFEKNTALICRLQLRPGEVSHIS